MSADRLAAQLLVGPIEEVATFDKMAERPDDPGLLIADGNVLLTAVQHKTVSAQVARWSHRH